MSETPIIWVHGDCLRPSNPAVLAYPLAPAVYVFDDTLLLRYSVSLKRIVFLYECLLELPVTIRRGDVVAEIIAFAREQAATHVVTTATPAPRFHEICEALKSHLPVTVLQEPLFLETPEPLDLRRFSRYWRTAQRYLRD